VLTARPACPAYLAYLSHLLALTDTPAAPTPPQDFRFELLQRPDQDRRSTFLELQVGSAEAVVVLEAVRSQAGEAEGRMRLLFAPLLLGTVWGTTCLGNFESCDRGSSLHWSQR